MEEEVHRSRHTGTRLIPESSVTGMFSTICWHMKALNYTNAFVGNNTDVFLIEFMLTLKKNPHIH